MYKKFYLMQKEPFDSHPSPELFYKSNAHQNGWNYLLHGIKSNEPILLVTGEYGAGKTLLYLKLMKLLEKNINLTSVFISTPTYNFIMVLEKILVELGISIDGIDPSDESRLQQAIYEHFEKKTGEKKKFIYIVIDDAQEFSYSFINKLRLFTSYNFSGYFPIRIILFAHPYFLKMLNHKKMVAFGQRIKRIYYLKPLGFEETREYIYFRLIHSGATGKPVFDDEAIKFIQTISKGNPRLINNICDNCLLVASSERCNLINQSLVSQAMAMGNLMGFEEIQSPRDSFPSSREVPGYVSGKPSLPEDIVYEKKSAKPADDNYGQTNKKFRDEDAYTKVSRTGKFENDPPEREAGEDSNLKNIRTRYGKISIIIVLTLIILFLLFYLFNRNKSNEMYNLQGRNEQIIRSMPDRFYTVENLDIFKKKDDINLSLDAVTKKGALVIEKKYQPIILMGNLM